MDTQRLEDLVKTNDAPSSEVLKEVKDMLQQPLHVINNLDAGIKSLEKRLEELKSFREAAQKRITPHQSILSPMRRVPTDVLSEIFQHCLPTNRNPTFKTDECPLLLTRVCKKWRELAITDSRLWSGLYTTFSDDDMVPAEDPDTDQSLLHATFIGTLSPRSRERATQMLRTRIEAVKEWISRAGTRPLSISLCFTTNFTRDTPHSNSDSAQNMTMAFFQFLASLSPRIESLELKMPIKIYRLLESLMEIPEMKALKIFKADFYSQILNRQDGWANPVAFLAAPNLRQVSMFGHENRIWGTQEPSRHWNALTHMAVHNPTPIAEFSNFLEHAPNLIHFQANIAENLDDVNGGPIAPIHFQRHIHLPFLRTLYICDDADPRRTGNLYEYIDAPSLRWVTYLGRFRPYSYSESNPPPIPILPLLRRSTNIKRLNIDSLDNTLWAIGRMLRAVPNLTHLIVGRESRSLKGSLIRTAPIYISPRLRQVTWDLGGLLALDDGSEQNVGLGDDAPLLPNLEILEISSHSGYLPDQNLKNFIISRLNPPSESSQRIANLKRVEILFYREVEDPDAEEEIRRHAGLVNAKIDLVLNYVMKHDEPPRSCAPSFGLHQGNGRSWSLGELSESYNEDLT